MFANSSANVERDLAVKMFFVDSEFQKEAEMCLDPVQFICNAF